MAQRVNTQVLAHALESSGGVVRGSTRRDHPAMPRIDRQRTPSSLLARILDQPDLVTGLQALPGDTLAKVVRHVGVEDAGELLALATSEQLVQLFDGELWRDDGEEERWDADAFATWLEVLGESGSAFVADRLAAMPTTLLRQALAEHVIVLDLDALALRMREGPDDDLLDKALAAPLSREIDRYLIVSRHPDGWDAAVEALVALDERHGALLQDLLEPLCGAAMEQVDESGLFTVLTEAEVLTEDAVAEREDRRTALGYVSLADAIAFDRLDDEARGLADTLERDAIAKAYFRRLDRSPKPPSPPNPLTGILRDAGVEVPEAPQLGAEATAMDALRGAMRELAGDAPEVYAQRLEELAFLTNVVLTLAGHRGEALRPAEAAVQATALCAEGLERLGDDARLRDVPLDVLYRLGRAR